MIIAVDIVHEKEALARRMGATHFVNSSQVDPVERIMEITTVGADYCFECVGSWELTLQAFACANRGWGEVVSVGMIPDSKPSPIVASALRNRTWKRTLMGSTSLDDIATFVDWSVEGKIDLSQIVSHRISLDEINDGIDLMHHGKATRVVIEY
jgi:S-(hydroxymethyl)glutathione dehydrogenase / alcohol dehydrogenase